jgi:hypothetical protein
MYLRFILGPTLFFFLKSFLENTKDRGKGTQNGEKMIVKQKCPEMHKVFFFHFPCPLTLRVRKRCKENSNFE